MYTASVLAVVFAPLLHEYKPPKDQLVLDDDTLLYAIVAVVPTS